MKLNETFTYAGATVEQVFGLISSQDFRSRSCEELGDLEHDVRVVENGGGATVTINRKINSDMPDFIKRLTGDTVKVLQEEVWGAAGADGSRKADVKVTIQGQPAHMVGDATISDAGGSAEFVLNGDVKVSIPFIGKKIEPEIAKAILSTLRSEVALGMKELS